MQCLRAFFLRHRAMAFAVVALALAMKALIPAGTMITTLITGDAPVVSIRLCDGTADGGRAVVLAVKGRPDGPGHDTAGKAMHDHQACPFSALGHAALGGADPFLLAQALGFILALGFVAQARPRLRRFAQLWPHLRGPPVGLTR